MIQTLKQNLKELNSLKKNDYMGDANGIIENEMAHVKNLIKLYEKA